MINSANINTTNSSSSSLNEEKNNNNNNTKEIVEEKKKNNDNNNIEQPSRRRVVASDIHEIRRYLERPAKLLSIIPEAHKELLLGRVSTIPPAANLPSGMEKISSSARGRMTRAARVSRTIKR